jgi:hypothetical protein
MTGTLAPRRHSAEEMGAAATNLRRPLDHKRGFKPIGNADGARRKEGETDVIYLWETTP